MSCQICVEKFNKINSEIKCDFCNEICCSSCYEKYILESGKRAECMFCHKQWSRKMLKSKFSKNFLDKKYKTYLQELFVEEEKVLFPETQIIVQNKKRLKEIKDEINILKKRLEELKLERAVLEGRRPFQTNENTEEEKEEKITQYKCQTKDCSGFINNKWKCSLCEKFTCSRCFCSKESDDNHECKDDDIESFEELKKSSKPCPNCKIRISKISGCDSMWCVNCHTSFSWNTGKIRENDKFHNPHYIEWASKNKNSNFTIDCDRQISIYDLRKINLEEIFRNLNHINRVLIDRTYRQMNNLDIRIKFMTKEIDEKKFKSLLTKRYKECEKRADIRNILNVVYDAGIDIIYKAQVIITSEHRVVDTLETIEMTAKKELEELRKYVNECFIDISETYDCVLHSLDEKFNFE